MSCPERVKAQYNIVAQGYFDAEELPIFIVGTQLIKSALGDCSGLDVLDLGGGTGVHARLAVDAGAASVDVVDLSPGMLRVGQKEEEKLNRVSRVRWLEGDASKPLDHLPLRQYDLVMSNFMVDHATSPQVLENMWRNIVANLKPGGRFVGAYFGNPRSPGVLDGKYGETCRDHEDIPGGVRYTSILHVKEPIEFVATSLEVSYSGSMEMHRKFGLVDIETEPLDNAAIVKEDPEFWKTFREDPNVVVVKARKRNAE